MFDICIIGGGAAGLIAAITAKQENPALKIAIAERLDRFGKKLSLTGNGRCNITNKYIKTENYHGGNPSFTESFFERFSVADTFSFFEGIGVPLTFEGDKAYPRSLQAASVTDALRFKVDELGIKTIFDCEINAIRKKGDFFELKSSGQTLCAKAVIAAGGLCSGGARLGCDGGLLEVLGQMGLKSVAPSPAIVQIKTDTDYVRQLKGIKVNASATLMRNDKAVRTECGEVLFCDYGLSGPPILQLSGHCKSGDKICLDLIPDMDYDALLKLLKARQKVLSLRKCDEFLSGLLNKRLGQVVMKRAGLKLDCRASEIGSLEKICRLIKNFSLEYKGNTGFANSQVSKGGLLTEQFDKNLMAKNIKGLFAAGEILDIDGDCGGYNLQWAWASGFCAAKGALEFLK